MSATALLTLGTCGPTASAKPDVALDFTRLDAAITQTMTDMSIPGITVGIWGPSGDYVRAFGIADKATKAPMRTDFYSRIGSVTKTFTVTALLQLVDQGKVSLDDPISRYIAGIPSGDQITLRELAQMQSGLKTYDDVAAFTEPYLADPARSYTPPQLVGYALDEPLQFAPGTQYQYCNTNLVLLGLVVEKQSGQALADYLSEHILAPLKLAHTSFPASAAFPAPHAQGYTVVDGRELDVTDWNPSWAWAAGNMVSTLDDMRIWAQDLATGTLLSPETQRQRLAATVPMNAENTASYGLGIFDDGGWLGHSGVIFGYQTAVFHLPQAQTTLVLFANTDVPHDVGTALMRAITSVITPDHVYR